MRQTNSRHIAHAPQQVEKAMRATIPHKSAVKATCDLLEKSHFFSIANNSMPRKAKPFSHCDLLEKSYFCSIAKKTIE